MPCYFEFEVWLERIRPRIWRRFLLQKEATFDDLHLAIQESAPWSNCHLFEFRLGGRRGEPIAGDDEGEEAEPARHVPLDAVFAGKGDECMYLYDFGDGWEHRVRLRAVRDLPEGFHRRLLAGARAFPPEDCGGVWGYQVCLAAVGACEPADVDASPDVLEERREWLPADWDPESFDLEAARAAFDVATRRRRRRTRRAGRPHPPEGPGPGADSDAGPDFPFGFPRIRVRIPPGSAIPVVLTPEAIRMVLELPGLTPRTRLALEEALSAERDLMLTLEQAQDVCENVDQESLAADRKRRVRLETIRMEVGAVTRLYQEADPAVIGVPDGRVSPILRSVLDLENKWLLKCGLISAEVAAQRTGCILADPEDLVEVRLTAGQRQAILQAVELPDALRQALTTDAARTTSIRLGLGQLAALGERISAATNEASPGVAGKLDRAFWRVTDVLNRYLPRDAGPPGPPGGLPSGPAPE
jgi:hypothetical protein